MTKPNAPPGPQTAMATWLERHQLERAEAGRMLDLSPRTIYAYASGDNATPRTVQLAMTALSLDLPAYSASVENVRHDPQASAYLTLWRTRLSALTEDPENAPK